MADKVPFESVHYRGGNPMMADLVTGRVDFSWPTLNTSRTLIAEKKLRALALDADNRWDRLPDVPTLDELGFGKEKVASWFALAGPAGMPPALVDRLRELFIQASKDPELQKRLAENGTPIVIQHAGGDGQGDGAGMGNHAATRQDAQSPSAMKPSAVPRRCRRQFPASGAAEGCARAICSGRRRRTSISARTATPSSRHRGRMHPRGHRDAGACRPAGRDRRRIPAPELVARPDHGLGGLCGRSQGPTEMSWRNAQGETQASSRLWVDGPIRWRESATVRAFEFLRQHSRLVPKVTLPAPLMLHMFGGGDKGILEGHYKDIDAFWADVVSAYRTGGQGAGRCRRHLHPVRRHQHRVPLRSDAPRDGAALGHGRPTSCCATTPRG